MDAAIISRIARETALPENSVAATVELFEKGATAPFIVRYRKEASGGMDEFRVQLIQERYVHYREVLDRRASILKLIADQGKLTDSLRERVESSFTKVELEDLFHQFRPKKRTRAAEAIEKGLEPLAEYLFNQETDAWSLQEHIDVFVDPTKKIASREQALQGATEIIAQWISENIDYRRTLREMLWNEGNVISTVVPAKAEQKTKYNMYYNRREPVTAIPSHRVLAIRRGSKEGILTSSIEADHAKAIEFLLNSLIRDKESPFAPILDLAVRESYTRILRPLIETEVRAQLKEQADREAIRVFQENLANLLLSPPAGQMVVAGLDMVKSGECTMAVVDGKGKFLEECAFRFSPPRASQTRNAPKPAAGIAEEPAMESDPEPQSAAVSAPNVTIPHMAPALEAQREDEPPESAAAVAEFEFHEDAAAAQAVQAPEVEAQAAALDQTEAVSEIAAQAVTHEETPPQAVEAGPAAPEAAGSVESDPAVGAPAAEEVPAAAGASMEPSGTPSNSLAVAPGDSPAVAFPTMEATPESIGAADALEVPLPAPQAGTIAAAGEVAGEIPPAGPPRPVTAEEYTANALAKIRALIVKHEVRAIAIGTSTGARDLESVLRQMLADAGLDGVVVAAVNDAGIAVYSSSRIAREELPDMAVSARCAVSLARRLQDPLAEMVKIDPKLIGVGQYQHDVDQKELHRGLLQTVQSCVSKVGVDINTAGHSLLRYVAGLNDRMAHRIIGYRSSSGPFPSRQALSNVTGFDANVFQQSAGFLRVSGGENPLDATAVHPESYPIVEKIASGLGVGLVDLIGNRELISSLKLEEYVTDKAGIPTLQDIREELLKPGRDPRKTFVLPKFRPDVKGLSDLQKGMTLEGTVTNVTNFGAFVDVGVQQDGLVHLSQMSNRFIRDPREAVKVGDVVQVKVISVEVETKRIGLSMKALLPSGNRRRHKTRRPPARDRHGETAAGPGRTEEAVRPETAEDGLRGATRHPGVESRGRRDRPHPRSRRRDNRRQERPAQPGAYAESDAKGQEPTLQEKIAILQSKFRGIS